MTDAVVRGMPKKPSQLLLAVVQDAQVELSRGNQLAMRAGAWTVYVEGEEIVVRKHQG